MKRQTLCRTRSPSRHRIAYGPRRSGLRQSVSAKAEFMWSSSDISVITEITGIAGGCQDRLLGNDGHVPQPHQSRCAQALQRAIQFENVSRPQRQIALIRLILRALRIVHKRRRGLLDVIAEHMGDGVCSRELSEAMKAGSESREVVHIEPAGIHRVAGQKDRGPAVVEGDGVVGVAGDRNDVQHAVSKVESADFRRPIGESEELLQAGEGRLHQRRSGPVGELRVAGDVIPVAVRVNHDERNTRALVGLQPAVNQAVHRFADPRVSGSSIPEQRPLRAKDQIQERLFVVTAAGLAKDEEGRVVFLNIELLHLRAMWSAGGPAGGKGAGLWLRTENGREEQECPAHGLTLKYTLATSPTYRAWYTRLS